MNNTIPFHSAPHAPQITVDVNILSMLKQAASCLTEMASENIYLAAIGPDMELTIIMEEDAPSIENKKHTERINDTNLFITNLLKFCTLLYKLCASHHPRQRD